MGKAIVRIEKNLLAIVAVVVLAAALLCPATAFALESGSAAADKGAATAGGAGSATPAASAGASNASAPAALSAGEDEAVRVARGKDRSVALTFGSVQADQTDSPSITAKIPFYDLHVGAGRTEAEVVFDPRAFFGDPTEYNHDLAKLSITLSEVAYSEEITKDGQGGYVLDRTAKEASDTSDLSVTPEVSDDVTKLTGYSDGAKEYSYIYNAFDKLGVEAKDVRAYYYENGQHSWRGGVHEGGYSDEGGYGVCAYAFGKRKVVVDGAERDLVIVMVRGTAQNGEWNSNFNIANAGPSADHQGFSEAERQVMDSLRTFCEDMDASETKMLVTGHSRGAAVASMLAAELDDSQSLVQRGNLFAYAFATPRVTTREGTRDAKYGNIFNILNPEDFVVHVALKKWGYERYGVDLVLPSRSNMHKGYAAAKAKCQVAYGAHFSSGSTTPTYKPYANGAHEVQGLVKMMYAAAPSVQAYYHPPASLSDEASDGSGSDGSDSDSDGSDSDSDGSDNTSYAYFQSLANYLAADGQMEKFMCMLDLASHSVAEFLPITQYFAVNELSEGLVMQAHQPETYLAWAYGFDSAGQGGQGGQEALSYGNAYKVLRFSDGVDVKVYDSADDLVCSIVGGEVDKDIMAQDNGLAAGVDDAGRAVVYLPADDSYRFETSGGEDATVVVESYDGCEELQGKTAAVSLPTQGEGPAVGKVAASGAPDGVSLIDAAGGEAAVQFVSAESLETYTVGVARQGGGSAWGGGEVLAGDEATVRAQPAGDTNFLGWFEGDTLASEQAVYRFVPERDVTLTAKFVSPEVAVPEAKSFTYDGQEKAGVAAGVGYELSGDVSATDVGSYVVTATPKSDFYWVDGSTEDPTEPVELSWEIVPASIDSASVVGLKTKTYTGKAITQSPEVKVGGRTLVEGADYALSFKDNVKVGKATVTLSGKGNYIGKKTATFTIAKAKQPMTAKAVKKTAKAATLKKKAVKLAKAVAVKKAKGAVSYKNASKAAKLKKFKVNAKKGTITVPKGTKRGIYKVKVKVTAKGNANYKAGSKTVTVKVTVK